MLRNCVISPVWDLKHDDGQHQSCCNESGSGPQDQVAQNKYFQSVTRQWDCELFGNTNDNAISHK